MINLNLNVTACPHEWNVIYPPPSSTDLMLSPRHRVYFPPPVYYVDVLMQFPQILVGYFDAISTNIGLVSDTLVPEFRS